MKIKHRRDLWKVIHVKGGAAEIGVAEGYFSADMLAWPVNFPRVYMVDRWKSTPTQKGDASMPQAWHEANLAAARNRVLPFMPRPFFLRGDSVEMAQHVPDRSLALVYIDGDHSYEGVKRDILAWIPKVMLGGIMAFHDYEAPQYGVKKAVNEFAHWNELDVILLPEDKPEDAGAYFEL